MNSVDNPGYWHIAFAVAGTAITTAAVGRGDQIFQMIGLGLLLFGIGEMKNHPYRERIYFNPAGRMTAKEAGYPRTPSVFGVVLDIIGVSLFFAGLVRFLIAIFG